MKKKPAEKPKNKRASKSKKAKIDESLEDSQLDEEPSINTGNGTESEQNNDLIPEANGTHDTPILDGPSTKSRLRSTCKSEFLILQKKNQNSYFS